MKLSIIALLLFFVTFTAAAGAELYKWNDSAGGEYYTDDIAKIPSEYRAKAQVLRHDTDQLSVETRRSNQSEAGAPAQPRVDNNGRNEVWWKNEADQVRKQIKNEQESLEYYHARQVECEDQQKNIVGYRRNCASKYEENIKRCEWNIQKYTNKLEVELPEQARKAGAYPGWLR